MTGSKNKRIVIFSFDYLRYFELLQNKNKRFNRKIPKTTTKLKRKNKRIK